MFFPRSISTQTRPTPESLCEVLSLPRIIYGQALLEWYEEISKLSPIHRPATVKSGVYLHSPETGLQLVIPTYQQGHGDSRHKITDQKILNCLKDGPMDTISIAKKILGRTIWRRPISATLYRMASEGKIIHHQEDDVHIWELTSSEPIIPIVVPAGPVVLAA